MPEFFIPGTDTAFVVSRSDGFSKVYKVDMSTLKFSAPVYATPGFDVQGVISDPDDRTLLGYRTFDGEMKAVYTDGKYREIQGFLDELFGKG